MNNKKSSVPKLRFPEFTDAWEQGALEKHIKTSTEKNLDNKFTKNDVLSVSGDVGIVNQIEFQGRSFAGVSVSNYGIVNTGDIVYTKSPLKANPYGIIKTNKGKAGIVSTLYAVYTPNQNTDSIFIQYYFEFNDRLNRYLKPLVNKGAKNDMKVSDDNALIGNVTFPKIQEQQKIGSFFTALDRLITTHQRKLENVKKLKKSLLQKMFPKNGQEFPEIRFPEFTDAWEQRKLGKLADFNPRSNLPDEFKYVDLESVVGTELTGYRFENKLSAPSRAQRLAQKGDIFYQTVRPYQKNNYLFEFEDENFVFSTGYAQLRPLINGRFLFSKLQEDRFVQQVLDKCTGTSYPAINSSDLSEIKVYIPDNKQEQQKIGSFFTALDRLITTHQRKLENVKNLKKALLQQMFV
ncbi:restriction endonuclease subunit S [Pasteurella sp. PK-2025]|uniref:restriction endonuclease subunit S n=1 Tax=Pasteurella sp. PK-2025 TaxID=3413133 RepID=UPI003C74531A